MLNNNLPIRWSENIHNPLISPPFPSPILADPTFLLPEHTPDGAWHMFAHSLFWKFSIFSILHFISTDGIAWKRLPDIAARSSLRPFLYQENGTYYLLYERIIKYFPEYHSWIEMISSSDLVHWQDANIVLKPALPWHKEGTILGSAGNPCLVLDQGVYRLYYSAGLVYLRDCKFSEPKYIGCATSENLLGPYRSLEEPIILPDQDDPYLNLGAGSMKVVSYGGKFVGFQNGIYWDPSAKHSGSAIRMWNSSNGIDWLLVSSDPIIKPAKGWKKSHVYANDVRLASDRWIMYFNARNGWIVGKEKIGRADSLFRDQQVFDQIS